jgi:hypothetical protein
MNNIAEDEKNVVVEFTSNSTCPTTSFYDRLLDRKHS